MIGYLKKNDERSGFRFLIENNDKYFLILENYEESSI